MSLHRCTEVCGHGRSSRSCSKICLAKVYPESCPEEAIKLYVVLDDQSNRSLARSEFFNLLHVKGQRSTYTLRTCAGVTKMAGRKSRRFRYRVLDGAMKVKLPTLIEGHNMPDDRTEIPTPDVTRWHTHLKPIAIAFLLGSRCPNSSSLGRDILQVHKCGSNATDLVTHPIRKGWTWAGS